MQELYHYGVLGMKWGVRKERKTGRGGGFGKKKSSSGSMAEPKPKTISTKDVWDKYDTENAIGNMDLFYAKDKRLGSGYATIIGWKTTLNKQSPYRILAFQNDLLKGSSDRDPNLAGIIADQNSLTPNQDLDLDKIYLELVELVSKQELTEEELNRIQFLSDLMTAMMSYFNGQYVQLKSSEEKEYDALLDDMSKKVLYDEELKKSLHRKAKVTVECLGYQDQLEGQKEEHGVDNTDAVFYKYTNPKGKVQLFTPDQYDEMLIVAKNNKAFYASTDRPTTREKKISDIKPVSIKKGKSLTEYYIERLSEEDRMEFSKRLWRAKKKKKKKK